MLKLVIRIKEESEDNVTIKIDKIKEVDFNKSTRAEKITASEIKTAIDYAIQDLKNKMKGSKEK